MYTIKAGHPSYLAIGIIFTISLMTLYFSEQSQAAFVSSTDPNIQLYYNDHWKIFGHVPASWTVIEQTNGPSFTGDGATLEIISYYPTPGTSFPSFDTPIEHVANALIKTSQNNPNLILGHHSPLDLSYVPAYQLWHSENLQGKGITLTDNIILISGGLLYVIKYTSPESLYDQTFPIAGSIISSLYVGDAYDTTIVPQLNENQDLVKATSILGQSVATGEADLGMQMLKDSVEDWREQDIERDKYYEGFDTAYNDDRNDDVIDSNTGEITDQNR